ncbi:MAG TPA: NAD(P)H-hydrate dehydratase [Mycobacteriales bacterium]|nr:NAD(P)H-hydrate dehydratase [Mycobacteriales bacterium]
MTGVWPVAEVRAAERRLMAGLPDGVLMRRAAAGLAASCAELLPGVYGARVALLVGAGGNGGDTLYAGALLAGRGARVDAVLVAPDRAHAGGLAALRAAGGRVHTTGGTGVVRGAELVVDGVVGIGGRGGLRPAVAELAEAAWDSGAVRVATDVPSGVDADTGEVPGPAFQADLTVTFGCLKPGLVAGLGRGYAGLVRLVDIGLLPHLPAPRLRVLGHSDVAALLPVPRPQDDKYSRGAVGVLAGSAAYGGAAVLTAGGAVRGGAGIVRYVGSAAAEVRARWPETIVSEARPSAAGRVQAWAVGSGLGTGEAELDLLAEVLATDLPVLVDADGITMLARRPDLLRARAAPTLLTPHDREFARLCGPVGPDRIGAARRAAADLGAAVLLKGDVTVVARPDGLAYLNPTGSPWLATAGSGDVLSGLGGALLAAHAGRPAVDVALSGACAAYLHGVAGGRSGPGTSATTVLDALPAALAEILATSRRTRVSEEPRQA